jgi:hypothetical protein
MSGNELALTVVFGSAVFALLFVFFLNRLVKVPRKEP